MTDSVSFALAISAPALVDGVAYARDLHNASRPGDPPLGSTAYLAFVVNSAVASYARQKLHADWREGTITKAQLDASLAALPQG